MSYREDTQLMNVLATFKIKCKCGHVMVFVTNREKIICTHCGRYIYRNKKLEFKDKLLKERRNNK